MAKRRRNNQGTALREVARIISSARRVAVHAPDRAIRGGLWGVPGIKLYRLRIALEGAGVNMGKARVASAAAIKARKTIKAKKGKQA
jgi:hypothetical protein